MAEQPAYSDAEKLVEALEELERRRQRVEGARLRSRTATYELERAEREEVEQVEIVRPLLDAARKRLDEVTRG